MVVRGELKHVSGARHVAFQTNQPTQDQGQTESETVFICSCETMRRGKHECPFFAGLRLTTDDGAGFPPNLQLFHLGTHTKWGGR